MLQSDTRDRYLSATFMAGSKLEGFIEIIEQNCRTYQSNLHLAHVTKK